MKDDSPALHGSEAASPTPLKQDISPKTYRKILSVSTSVLAFLAILYTFYFAADIILPITLSILFTLVLQPFVKGLGRVGLPSALASALVVATVISTIFVGFYSLSGPAGEWAKKAPEIFTDVRAKIEPLKKPLSQIQDVKDQVEGLANSTTDGSNIGSEDTGSVSNDLNLLQTLQASSYFFVNGVFVMVLVFFMLASESSYLRKLVTILPTFKDKRRAVEMVNAIQICISRYLATITVINAGVGILTTLAMWLLDMPNPILWGILATMLNFVPYIGPALFFVIISIVLKDDKKIKREKKIAKNIILKKKRRTTTRK